MAVAKRIQSIAAIRSMGDQLLTECYVVGIGYSGLSAMAEHPVPPGTPVLVDITFVGATGAVEAESVAGRVLRCRERPGACQMDVAFVQALHPESPSRLAAFIQRDLGPERPAAGPPRYHEAAGGSA
ncbi:MAG: hypothetical protein HZA24_02455 [Nitrospirae bacterium]|nr:hypothetical protein [Nitrospirota bacterium]